MCGCNDTANFEQYLSKAKAVEQLTETKQIVYIRKIDEQEYFYLRPLTDAGTEIMQDVDVYFTTDGTKHDNVPKPVEFDGFKETPKKKAVKKKTE